MKVIEYNTGVTIGLWHFLNKHFLNMVMVFTPPVAGAKLSIKRPFFKFVSIRSVSRIRNIEKIRAILSVTPILNHVLKTVQPSLKNFLKSIINLAFLLDCSCEF